MPIALFAGSWPNTGSPCASAGLQQKYSMKNDRSRPVAA